MQLLREAGLFGLEALALRPHSLEALLVAILETSLDTLEGEEGVDRVVAADIQPGLQDRVEVVGLLLASRGSRWIGPTFTTTTLWTCAECALLARPPSANMIRSMNWGGGAEKLGREKASCQATRGHKPNSVNGAKGHPTAN